MAVEYRAEQHIAKLGPRHRSSVVELSIRNRAVVGSNPTGGSCGTTTYTDRTRDDSAVTLTLNWGYTAATRSITPATLFPVSQSSGLVFAILLSMQSHLPAQ